MDGDCYILSDDELKKIAVSRGVAAGLVAILSLTATYIVILRVFCCIRHTEQSKDFFPHAFCTARYVLSSVFNPFLWVAIAYTLSCLSYAAHIWVVFKENDGVCYWFGFAIQWLESYATAMSAFLSLYISYYILSHGRPLTDNELNQHTLSSRTRYLLHAVVVGFFVIFLPLGTAGYNIPFLVHSYGPNSGPWCWIEDESEQLFFWHIPFWSLQVVTLVVMVVNVIIFCCKVPQRKAVSGKMTALSAILILIYAHLLRGSFAAFETIVRLVPSLSCNDTSHAFWYIHSVMTPLSKLFTIVAVLVFVAAKPLRKKTCAEFQPLI